MTYDIKALRDLEKRLAEAKVDSAGILAVAEAALGDVAAPLLLRAAIGNSLDAAVALVERVLPHWHLCVQGVNKAWSARLNPTAHGKVGDGFANHASPALALCLALVRALITQEEARQ